MLTFLNFDSKASQLGGSDSLKSSSSLSLLLSSLLEREIPIVRSIPALLLKHSGLQRDKAALCLCTGSPPLLLLPENVRIRKYNISSEKFSEYLEEEEHIQTIDYDWDPEGIGLSEYETCTISRCIDFLDS